jgi:YHS domain-containing protein
MLFTWIIRLVVGLFLIRLVLRAIFGDSRVQQRRGPAPAPPQPIERAGGALVRDPQCGTYIPQSSALTMRTGGETWHFCSAACRDAWTAARRAQDVKAG